MTTNRSHPRTTPAPADAAPDAHDGNQNRQAEHEAPVSLAPSDAPSDPSSQPPAEAQAQGGGEVDDGASDASVWALIALMEHVGGELDSGEEGSFITLTLDQVHALEALLTARGHDPGWVDTAPSSAPVGVGGLSDVFNLVRACESAVRRLGWRSSDYSLGHEARMLAQGYENGAFQTARETLHALAQQPAAEFRNDGNSEADFIAHHADACTACGGSGHKADQQPAARDEMSPEFTDSARAAIAWVLYHHQGGSSPVGQPLRFALGMGADEQLPDWRIAEAKRWAEWAGATTADFHRQQPAAVDGRTLVELGERLFQFESKQDWINQHQRPWKRRGVGSQDTVCLDQLGRLVSWGEHFSAAERDNAYPIVVYRLRADMSRALAAQPQGGA